MPWRGTLTTIGAKVVLKEKFETGAIDFKPLLSKVKAAQPDVDLHGLLCQRGPAHHEASQGTAASMRSSSPAARPGSPFPSSSTGRRRRPNMSSAPRSGLPRSSIRARRRSRTNTRPNMATIPSYHGASAYAAMYVTADALDRRKELDPGRHPRRAEVNESHYGLRTGQVRGQGRLSEPELRRHLCHPGPKA